MGVIPASKTMLVSQYPRRDALDQPNKDRFAFVAKVMTRLPGTPCCVQMSYALNMSGVVVPPSSYRRRNESTMVNKRLCYFIAATDELEEFLTGQYGEPEEVGHELGGKARTAAGVKAYIQDRPGILIFRRKPPKEIAPAGMFEHTEVWDGRQIQQRDMNEEYLFTCDRVLLWDTNDVAKFLVDYMAKQG